MKGLKLYSGRKKDPEVKIEIPVGEDVFNESVGKIASRSYTEISSFTKSIQMKYHKLPRISPLPPPLISPPRL